MKQTAIILLILSLTCVLSCITAVKIPKEPGWTVLVPEKVGVCTIDDLSTGWCNNDTYRGRGEQPANNKYSDTETRIKKARIGAIIMAQYNIKSKLEYEFRIEGCTGMPSTEEEIQSFKEVEDSIRNGRVIAERFDSNGFYSVIYEVRLKNLKKKAQAAYFRDIWY